MKGLFLYISGRWHDFYERYRPLLTFLFVVVVMGGVDIIFFKLHPSDIEIVKNLVSLPKSQSYIDFAPEVWLALLSMVLGTLIIVISIASQSTPKLIDLYTRDQISLLYIWFITLGSAHSLWLQLYASTGDTGRDINIIIITYIYLPIGLILALPYIIYILRYTKPSNVIGRIYYENSKRIELLGMKSYFFLLNQQKFVEHYQYMLFDALNQLDDLLEYVSFKEPKGDIIDKIAQSVIEYVEVKKNINPNFFQLTDKVKEDISFKTLTAQFEEVEHDQTFYEQKAFRLLGNAYYKLIEKNDFDLASQCVSKLALIGNAAIRHSNDPVINSVIIRLNTTMRFSIKHGLRNKEIRNIYNALFHYSEYIKYFIDADNKKFIRKSCNFLKIYGTETFKHSQQEPSFAFLVDVFAFELRRALIFLCENEVDLEFQKDILDMLLSMDNPPDFDRDALGHTRIINDGVRVLQIGLCLYYLNKKQHELASQIVDDIIDDYKFLGNDIQIAVDSTCNKLKVFTPTFWEDTDRGNANMYYVKEKDQIPEFLSLFRNKFNEFFKSSK